MNIRFTKKEILEIKNCIDKKSEIEIINLLLTKISQREKYIEKDRIRIFKKQQDKEAHKKLQLDQLLNVATEYKTELIKNQTNSEKTFKAILKSLDIDYEFQKIILTPKSFYIVDFYIPKKNIVFEIDGGYHLDKEQISKDRSRTRILKSNGITKVFRFTNKQVEDNIYTAKRVIEIMST